MERKVKAILRMKYPKFLTLLVFVIIMVLPILGCDNIKKYNEAKKRIEYLEKQLQEKEETISNLYSRIYDLEKENKKLKDILEHHQQNMKKMFD